MSEENFVLIEERGQAGLITLNRPKALNALSLPMIRQITQALLRWKHAAHIERVAIRGMGKDAQGAFVPFGSFCAGGDIRFFHQAALAGDPALEDFFTEEYSLNYLIHTYPKAYVSFLDGIVMGGGMGIAGHGASNSLRIVTERSKMAMPETMIGLFPDVGGGYFLSRCVDSQLGVGEYLALTGQMLHAADAQALGLADLQLPSEHLGALWNDLAALGAGLTSTALRELIATKYIANYSINTGANSRNSLQKASIAQIAPLFATGSVTEIIQRLERDTAPLSQEAALALRKRSPLMLHVSLELVRRARSMSLADELRLERDLVRHCFHTKHLSRSGAATETAEGIRALAVDKDHSPKWQPARIEDISAEMVAPFFVSPWPAAAHPLRDL